MTGHTYHLPRVRPEYKLVEEGGEDIERPL